jgi:DnaK suppressor protein
MRRLARLAATEGARKTLLERKERLARLAAGLRSGESQLITEREADRLDRAAGLEQQGILENLHSVESRELAEIDAALRRVEQGTYGRCQACGEHIGPVRLHAVPEARFCIRCLEAEHPRVP